MRRVSATGDANGDGAVDTADYTIWADHYTGSSVGAVPEPHTITLLGMGVLVLAVTAWRRQS
jgi:hypothetical protein